MKRIFYFLAFQVLFLPSIYGQKNVDSLVKVLETGELDFQQKIELYKEIGLAYSYNNHEKSMKYAEEGMALAQKVNDKARISNFNHIIGLNHYTKTNYDSAIIYCKKALELAIEVKDIRHEGGLYTSIGSSYSQLSEFNMAMEYYLKALAIHEMQNDKVMCMTTMGNLSTLHRRLHNNDRAIYYLEQIKEMAEELNYLPGKCRAYFDLGAIYSENKEYEKALEYELKVVEISRSTHLKQYEIASMATIAEIYSEGFGEHAKAEKYANEAMKTANEFGDSSLQRAIWVILSDIYRRQGMFKESSKFALKAWKIPSKELDTNRKLLSNLTWANIYLGNKDKAISFFEDYETATSEFNKKSLHESLLDMEVKYETEKKALHIATLEKEKQLYIWLSILGGFVLLLALCIAFYRNRLNIQKVKQLEQEKLLIATQSELDGETAERTRLAQDLHDGLGGMLSAVRLNLIDVNTSTGSDMLGTNRFDKALDMLEKSINELRRVAHHIMPESLMRYGLRTAIEDFCHAIPYANFQFFGDEQEIDKRLAIVIYRSAFELVNNALKHADATVINVQLLIDNGLIALTVQDNGKGFNPENIQSGSGLKNIRTRISVYNGKMNIYSSPENGTEVTIEIENQ